MLLRTPSQTVGPFFAILVPERGRLTLAGDATPGPRILVEGAVRDGAGAPVPDALVEIWQANAAGRYAHPEDTGMRGMDLTHNEHGPHSEPARTPGPDPGFEGFGRVHTDAEGRFSVGTIKPGRVPGPAGRPQAPHLLVGLFARGLLMRLVTRIYFAGEFANAEDPILAQVAPDRRSTLVAARRDDGRYRHVIVLQGPGETVFFDV